MTTYARARLLTEDDKRYRAYVDGFKLQRKNNKAIRPPRQRYLFGAEAEAALRTWLGERVELDERRIIEYEERRNKRAVIKYREIDALHLEPRAAWVFEFKASRNAGALRRAVGQLEETRRILKLLYHTVHVTILLVDTGIPATVEEVDALMAGERPPPRRPELLGEVLEAVPALRLIDTLDERSTDGATIDVLRFSVDAIIALAGVENLSLDWEADDLEDEEPPEPRPAASLYASSADETADDDDDNPLAAALRKAGLK
jgi:hypothetical protein